MSETLHSAAATVASRPAAAVAWVDVLVTFGDRRGVPLTRPGARRT